MYLDHPNRPKSRSRILPPPSPPSWQALHHRPPPSLLQIHSAALEVHHRPVLHRPAQLLEPHSVHPDLLRLLLCRGNFLDVVVSGLRTPPRSGGPRLSYPLWWPSSGGTRSCTPLLGYASGLSHHILVCGGSEGGKGFKEKSH